MITFKELSEAHKVGDKVTIVKGPKDVKGKEGRIGEIRKQAYKGAPKTYTVDYDHHETTGERKSVQLQAKHIKGVKEDTMLESDAAWAAAKEKEKEDKLTSKDKSTYAKLRQMLDKEKKPVKEDVEMLEEKHRVAITLSDPKHPAVTKRKELIQKTVRVQADNPGHAVDSAIHHFRKAGYKVHDHHYIGTVKEDTQLDELSTDTLASYKTKAHADAKAADASGNYAKGDKRFKGINKATNKQFDNDLKKHGQYQKEDLEEGTFKYHMDKAVAAHDRGDVNRKKFHLSNAKQARYALKSTDIPKHKDLLDKYKSMTEGTNLEEGRGSADKHYSIAQDHKDKADKASDKQTRHAHLADYHDSMAHYHDQLGQHSLAQSHSDKAEINHEKSLQKNEAIEEGRDYDDNRRGFSRREREDDEYHVPDPEVKKNKVKKEDVVANNVGNGNIAGTQGDAGKKAVMTKKPMKRNIIQFKEYAIDAKGHKSSTGGLTQKGVDAYNRKTGGNLQTAVTTPPSKLDPDSKAAKRRKSFCARMGGMPGPMKDEKGRPTRKALALRKWNC